jgi:uncharacterized protein (UPF0128 family)
MTTVEKDLYTNINSGVDDNRRISVSEWEDGGVYVIINVRGGSANIPLTKENAEQLIAAIQKAMGQ